MYDGDNTDHDRFEIDRRYSGFDEKCILVIDGRGEDREITALLGEKIN